MGLARTIRWRPLEGSGLEHVRINQWDSHIRMRGSLIGETGSARFSLFYEIALRTDWTFDSILIQTDTGVMETLVRDEHGAWRDMAGDRPDLKDCVDIDLSGSPLTNTLPIRRITDWRIGEPRWFEMAYIDLPDLKIGRDGQVYTKLSDMRFRYAAADGGFSAEVEIDADGFIVSYPPLFTRA